MAYGYTGKILRVNLSTGSVSIEEHDDQFYRTYFGGRGIISYYLLKELPVGVDPLSPMNKLIFAAGPVTGAPVPGCGRNSVGGKNPLTGSYGETEVGGYFGAELKHAGFDAIVVDGKSPKPVYLWVHDGQAEIRDAGHLWGESTGETQEAIRQELGDKLVRTALIGPGGEKMVRYACVINDLNHAGGRAGMGAVMGSKNLKAVAARGRGGMQLADPEKVRGFARWMGEHWKELHWDIHENGTDSGLIGLHTAGGLPTRNFREGVFEGAEKITGQTMTKTLLVDTGGCYACVIRCKRIVKAEQPYKVDPLYGGPEYETCASLGSLCGVDDLVAICKGNEICNANSLDTIGTGTTIAFAMECFENGLLTKEQTGGIDLRFGNADAMVKMVELIAKREGLGNLLAEGTLRAAKELGPQALRYAMQTKGQEFPMHEPRFKQGMGMGYTVCPTGACHVQSFHDAQYEKEGTGLSQLSELGLFEAMPTTELSPRKVRSFVYGQHWWSFLNSAVICIIPLFTFNQWAEIVSATTGWELLKMGERGTTLARAFNVREGFTAADDTLPERMFEPLPSGPLKGVAVDRQQLADAIQTYYGMMGWNSAGVPTAAKLAELNVGWVADLL